MHVNMKWQYVKSNILKNLKVFLQTVLFYIRSEYEFVVDGVDNYSMTLVLKMNGTDSEYYCPLMGRPSIKGNFTVF